MTAYRRPPGHRVLAADPLSTWLQQHPDPIEGPAGLATATGVSVTTLRRLRNHRTTLVRESTADRIATALERSLSDIYADPNPMFQNETSI